MYLNICVFIIHTETFHFALIYPQSFPSDVLMTARPCLGRDDAMFCSDALLLGHQIVHVPLAHTTLRTERTR